MVAVVDDFKDWGHICHFLRKLYLDSFKHFFISEILQNFELFKTLIGVFNKNNALLDFIG